MTGIDRQCSIAYFTTEFDFTKGFAQWHVCWRIDRLAIGERSNTFKTLMKDEDGDERSTIRNRWMMEIVREHSEESEAAIRLTAIELPFPTPAIVRFSLYHGENARPSFSAVAYTVFSSYAQDYTRPLPGSESLRIGSGVNSRRGRGGTSLRTSDTHPSDIELHCWLSIPVDLIAKRQHYKKIVSYSFGRELVAFQHRRTGSDISASSTVSTARRTANDNKKKIKTTAASRSSGSGSGSGATGSGGDAFESASTSASAKEMLTIRVTEGADESPAPNGHTLNISISDTFLLDSVFQRSNSVRHLQHFLRPFVKKERENDRQRKNPRTSTITAAAAAAPSSTTMAAVISPSNVGWPINPWYEAVMIACFTTDHHRRAQWSVITRYKCKSLPNLRAICMVQLGGVSEPCCAPPQLPNVVSQAALDGGAPSSTIMRGRSSTPGDRRREHRRRGHCSRSISERRTHEQHGDGRQHVLDKRKATPVELHAELWRMKRFIRPLETIDVRSRVPSSCCSSCCAIS